MQFVIYIEPTPITELNLDWLEKRRAEIEAPIRVVLVEAENEDEALLKHKNDDIARLHKTGIISVVKAWEALP